jgi:hypothetical protein
MRYGFLIGLVAISLVVISFNISHAETINYFYDDLHRLIRVEFESGRGWEPGSGQNEYLYDQLRRDDIDSALNTKKGTFYIAPIKSG